MRLRLSIDPVQNSDLGSRSACRDQPFDRPRNAERLGRLVVELHELRLRPRRALPDQLQTRPGDPPARRTDHAVRQRHDLRGGAVIPFEPNDGRFGEFPGEVQQIVGGGSGEGVDGLIRIAHHGQIVSVAQPGVEHTLLQWGDVLILVHDEAAIPLAELVGDCRMLFESCRRVQ